MEFFAMMFFMLTAFLLKYTVTTSTDENADFFSAIFNGNVEEVQYLLFTGASVNAVNKWGYSALMLAASTGNSEIVQLLIQNGADVNATGPYQQTALSLTVSAMSSEEVNSLINNGVAVNEDRQVVPMMATNERVYPRFWIEYGEDVEAVDVNHHTALVNAPPFLPPFVHRLIEHGKHINAVDIEQPDVVIGYFYVKQNEMDRFDLNACEALLSSFTKESLDIAKLLVESGASIQPLLHSGHVEFVGSLRRYCQWNLTDLEEEYQIISMEVDLEMKEQQLSRLWTKVESRIFLGANVREVIYEESEESVYKNFPRINCVDGVVESFLFNYFEYFQSKVGFNDYSVSDFGSEFAVCHLSVEEVEAMFRIQFSGMTSDQIKESDSVNEFLVLNQNVIRFADYIGADDLLNKIADLIVSFNIYNFDHFWNDFKLIFGYFEQHNEHDVIVVLNPHFRELVSKLLLAAIIKEDNVLIESITFEITEDDVGFDFEAFFIENNIPDYIQEFALEIWTQ